MLSATRRLWGRHVRTPSLSNYSEETEYWVSNVKKYCDFCKCTIADNRPSVQFHENGKKHRENVRIRLAEMQKKATKEAAAASTVEKQMKKMEDAAMRAYLKDMEANPDFTSQAIKEKLADSQLSASLPSPTSPPPTKERVPEKKPAPKDPPVEKKWMEAKSDQGHTYYWHTETGESVWQPPTEGYISIKHQETSAKTKTKKTSIKSEPKEVSVSEMNNQIYRSSLSSQVKEEPQELETGPIIGPSPRVDPYGSWTTIVKEENSVPDLQLPEVKYEALPVPAYVPEERPRVFKEKIAPVSSAGGEVAFKKRKFGGARNARQRLDDD